MNHGMNGHLDPTRTVFERYRFHRWQAKRALEAGHEAAFEAWAHYRNEGVDAECLADTAEEMRALYEAHTEIANYWQAMEEGKALARFSDAMQGAIAAYEQVRDRNRSKHYPTGERSESEGYLRNAVGEGL